MKNHNKYHKQVSDVFKRQKSDNEKRIFFSQKLRREKNQTTVSYSS